MTRIPIHNAVYQSPEKIKERYLTQLSIAEDEKAAQKIEWHLTNHGDVATTINQAAGEFGLARVKNVLDRWESSVFGIEQFPGYELEPLEVPIALQGEGQEALLEMLEMMQAELRKAVLDTVQEIERRMIAEMQQLGEELAGVSSSEILANAHRLGCYYGIIEYVQEWQGLFDDEIGASEKSKSLSISVKCKNRWKRSTRKHTQKPLSLKWPKKL